MIQAIVFILCLCYDIYTDQKLIKQGKSPKHAWSATIRTLGLLAGAGLEYGIEWQGLVSVIGLTLTYWFVFDFMLNLFMGWPLFYNGETSTIDRIIRRIPDEAELIIKGSLILLSVLAFVLAANEKKNNNPNDKLKEP